MKHERLIDAFPTNLHGQWYKFVMYPHEPVPPDHYLASPIAVDKPSDYQDRAAELWFSSNYTGGSDYNGSAVDASNFKILSEYKCKKVVTDHEMYGSYQVYFRGDLRNKDIIEILSALTDYPVISDTEMCDIELEWQNNWWEESFNRQDIAKELEQLLYVIIDDSDTIMGLCYFVNQQGNGWEWEYCGTGATLIHAEYTIARAKIGLHHLVEHGVQFILAEGWDDTITPKDKHLLFKAAAAKGITLTDEDDNDVLIPNWAYPNPNQLLLLQDK